MEPQNKEIVYKQSILFDNNYPSVYEVFKKNIRGICLEFD